MPALLARSPNVGLLAPLLASGSAGARVLRPLATAEHAQLAAQHAAQQAQNEAPMTTSAEGALARGPGKADPAAAGPAVCSLSDPPRAAAQSVSSEARARRLLGGLWAADAAAAHGEEGGEEGASAQPNDAQGLAGGADDGAAARAPPHATARVARASTLPLEGAVAQRAHDVGDGSCALADPAAAAAAAPAWGHSTGAAPAASVSTGASGMQPRAVHQEIARASTCAAGGGAASLPYGARAVGVRESDGSGAAFGAGRMASLVPGDISSAGGAEGGVADADACARVLGRVDPPLPHVRPALLQPVSLTCLLSSVGSELLGSPVAGLAGGPPGASRSGWGEGSGGATLRGDSGSAGHSLLLGGSPPGSVAACVVVERPSPAPSGLAATGAGGPPAFAIPPVLLGASAAAEPCSGSQLFQGRTGRLSPVQEAAAPQSNADRTARAAEAPSGGAGLVEVSAAAAACHVGRVSERGTEASALPAAPESLGAARAESEPGRSNGTAAAVGQETPAQGAGAGQGGSMCRKRVAGRPGPGQWLAALLGCAGRGAELGHAGKGARPSPGVRPRRREP